jgi:putative transcriptional regulator
MRSRTRLGASFVILTAALGLFSSRAARAEEHLAEGQLLVADPDLDDNPFAETVILLMSYNREGAMGLVINRPTNVPLAKALDTLKEAQGSDDPVFVGGPVEESAVLALYRSRLGAPNSKKFFEDLNVVSDKDFLRKMLTAHTKPDLFRVYFGYAGWGPGQLEAEVKLGAWHVFKGNTNTVFDPDPETLWRRMVRSATEQLASVPNNAPIPGKGRTKAPSRPRHPA